jgi:hypothetical protein
MTDAAPVFRIHDHVSHERLDGEVVVMDTRNGAYFNLGGTAADCWTLLAEGWPVEEWQTILESRYGEGVFDGLTDFVQLCVQYELAEKTSADPSPSERAPVLAVLPDDQERTSWSIPEIVRFDDLQDLIKIDPIHDTSAFGWPSVDGDVD